MGKVFDGADYDRQLEQAGAMSAGQELRLIASGGLSTVKAHQEAKQAALMEARRQILAAIRAEEQRVGQGAIPHKVEEIVTGKPGDELVKV